MMHQLRLGWLAFALVLAGLLPGAQANPNPIVDCNCVANLPALHTTCPGIVPDLGLIATNCFSTNVNLAQMGYYFQNPPAGTWLGLGTNSILLTIYDTNYNPSSCTVDFIVTPPAATNLTFTCTSNKTVECGTAWQFDTPVAFSTCCDPGLSVIVVSTITNGTCPKVITKTWQASDMCGHTNSCSQIVTVQDTSPPFVLCSGANLVPNPGFESLATCLTNFSQLDAAYPWFQPTIATPDCFNVTVCPPLGTNVGIPNNAFGFQPPFNGQGYAGAFVYGPDSLVNTNQPYREYIETPLLAPLIAGLTYQVAFHVNLADFSGKGLAELGAYFSAGPAPVIGVGDGIIPVVPQVVNPPGNLISSTSAWVLVQGTFVAAGGEDHMTIGNFLTDANTTSTNLPSPPQYALYGYCYYDDVSVEAICAGQVTNKIVQCGSPFTFDPPVGFDLCSGTNVAVSIVSTITNGICPQVITRNWSLTDLCGNTTNWSQTVTIVDTTPPTLFCPTNNLVPNGDFESYTNCPDNLSETEYAAPWFTPTLGTSDYFNSCAGPGGYASVPVNLRGYQFAFSGQGYAGGEVFSINNVLPNKCYREYIESPLVAPLVAGQAYQVSFRVSLADNSGFAIAEVGAHFSVGPLTDYSGSGLLTVTPQIENPSYNVLTSTNSWMLVQGIFTAAGGEDHITIGSFKTDVNLTSIAIPGGIPSICEYYYDDVSVVPLCGETLMNKNVPCGAPWNFNQPAGIDNCSGTNVTVSVASTTTNACGTFFTRTWTLTDQCGNATNWTQTISISDPSPLTINCGCLQELASSLLYTNACLAVVPNLLQFTNCFSTNCRPVVRTQSPAAGTIVGAGTHPITVSVTDCAGNSNGCAFSFVVSASPPIVICPKDITLFTCGASAPAYFAPMISGNTGTIVCTPPSGSLFPLNTSTLVTCTVTNDCGLSATCMFAVTVLRPPTRWSCFTIIVVGIPITPIGSAYVNYLAPLPGGGLGVDFANLGSSGQDGVQLDLGAAQKITFSTVLDFTAPSGATFNLSLPGDASTGTTGETVLTFTKSCAPRCGWNVTRPNNTTGSSHRSIAIGADGQLFSSFTQDGATLGTNILANIGPDTGVTSVVMTVTLDCLTREATLDFPFCDWTPDAGRKGWDGLIYGNGPRGSTTNKTSRIVLTPLTTASLPPFPTLDIIASNLTTLAFDNPTITAVGRKWGDGHVTLMKAYDDGDQGLEFASFGVGGGVSADLGHASSFRLKISHFENGDIPNEEEIFSIRGWPPGTTTNRPPPPPILLRLAQGSSGVDCSADFGTFGVSNVTLQLWNGTTLVKEQAYMPASISTPFASISGFPGILSCPGGGVLSLASTNPFTVLSGVGCPGCSGTELRILPEFATTQPAPTVFTDLQCQTSDGMDLLFYDLQRTLACTPGPLNIVSTPAGVTLSWTDDDLRLQGAETVAGPWYDLGVTSPATIPADSNLRLFRLLCD